MCVCLVFGALKCAKTKIEAHSGVQRQYNDKQTRLHEKNVLNLFTYICILYKTDRQTAITVIPTAITSSMALVLPIDCI